MIAEGSLKQRTMLFMMERRLTIDEAAAVMRVLETDSSLSELHGAWHEPAHRFRIETIALVHTRVQRLVAAWQDKYRPDHPGRWAFE